MAVLEEAKNVKYGQFVAPGHSLRVEVELNKLTESGATFKATGFVESDVALSARIEMAYFNLAERQAALEPIDEKLRAHNRARWALLESHAATTLDAAR